MSKSLDNGRANKFNASNGELGKFSRPVVEETVRTADTATGILYYIASRAKDQVNPTVNSFSDADRVNFATSVATNAVIENNPVDKFNAQLQAPAVQTAAETSSLLADTENEAEYRKDVLDPEKIRRLVDEQFDNA